MKIIHVCVSDVVGGAAKAAYSINKALNDAGQNSVMLVQKKHSSDSTVFSYVDSLLKELNYLKCFLIDYLLIKYLTINKKGRFSIPYFGADISKHPLIKNADIINLHWINGGFFSHKTFESLAKLNKPIVWTLHDMWAFTGGCHYSGGCDNYLTGCNNCPSLKFPGKKDLSFKIFNGKKTYYEKLNLHLVTCSNWLAGEVKKSKLLSNYNVTAIPNPIDINIYKPIDKQSARQKFNLAFDKLYILFGTMTLKEERKGFNYLLESLKFLYNKYPDIRDKIEILIFGAFKDKGSFDIPFNINFLGRISDIGELVKCYNAADVFVAPSLEDNLPNTVMESLACGLPVVAFNIGGIPDMVEHLKNGYLARPKSIESLAEGILWVLNKNNQGNELAIEARNKVVDNFTPEIVGEKYAELYSAIMNE